MSTVPTFQDLLADFSDQVFVGRSEQLALFEQALTAPRPPFLILAVSGQGGVGKTTLLERFRRMAADRQVLTALVNEDQTAVPETLYALARQFDLDSQSFKSFIERYQKYGELKQQIAADPKAPRGFFDTALRGATRVGLRSLRRLPVAGEAAEVFITPEAEDRIADGASALAIYVAQKFAHKGDRALLLETHQELSRHFVNDLNALAGRQRLVLLFDTYEKTAPFLEAWLLDLLAGQFGQFSSQVLFVVAGRYPLGQAWTRFRKATRQVELQEFTEAEAREYLQTSGISDEKEIVRLIQLSDRLPVLLAFLVSAPGEVPTDVSGTAVERFLQGATPEQKEAALAASVPRFFNQDVLAVILGSEAAAPAFEWLSEAHFVRPGAAGWAYHDVVRSLMLRHFRLRSAQRCVEVHAALAAHYRAQAEALGLPAGEQRRNATWRQHEIERLYHHLSQNPARCLEETLAALLDNLLDDLALVGSEAAEACLAGFATLLSQVYTETQAPVLEAWVEKLRCFKPSLVQDSLTATRAAMAFFTALGNLLTLGEKARSAAFLLCGTIAAESKEPEWEKALDNMTKAIELLPHHGFYYQTRGVTYFGAKDYPAALADFSRAIDLQPENSLDYYWRGRTLLEAGDYSTALNILTKAIELRPQESYNYTWRGFIYLRQRDYPAAMADFAKAIELQPEVGFHYQGRGRVYLETKDYLTALADFTQAAELQPKNSYNYYWCGRAYLEMHDYPAALLSFTRAINLRPEDSHHYYWRGYAHRDAQDYPAALADFNQAIELQPENGNNYRGRGSTYLYMKDYPAALTDLTRAIELQPENVYHYHWRGRAYRAVQDYPAALADFSRAIELLPDNVYNYAWRGHTYLDIQDYPAALADFSRTVALEPDDAYSYAWRSRVYLALNDLENAQADLAQVKQLIQDDGESAYVAAVGCARAAQVGEACALLRLAFECDASLAQKARSDADLDPIREAAEFTALLAEFDRASDESSPSD